MQETYQVRAAVAGRHNKICDISNPNCVRQLPFCGRDDLPQRDAGAAEHEPGAQHHGQKPTELSGKASTYRVHRRRILRATRLPVPAEMRPDVVLAQVVVEAVVEYHQLWPRPTSVVAGADVDVPRVGVRVHAAVDEDHLCKCLADQQRALRRVEAGTPEGDWVVDLDQVLAELHGQEALGRVLPVDLRDVDPRRQVGQLPGRLLAVRGLQLEIEFP
mmetsp:Transcript_104054/g.271698  ORF Transcript_104054/g.271698 Transcript_104054/m.271698 type:complete len:217 (+) Transcript_104054:376-1026(+)